MKFPPRRTLPWLVLLGGGVLSCLAFAMVRSIERKSIRLEFSRRCQVLTSVIETAVREHEDSLYSLRNQFHYSTNLTRAEFAGIAEDLVHRHEGIHALEWVRRVPHQQRSAVEDAVRAEGFPDFQFTNRAGGPKLKRASDHPEYFPVIYVHPFTANRAALGFDLASGVTWPDMEQSARDNALIVSGRLPLITDGSSMDWGYILSLPVYSLPIPNEPAQRSQALLGYVLGIYRLSELVEGALARFEPQGMEMLLVDRIAPPEQRILHFHVSRLRSVPVPPPTVEVMKADPFAQTLSLRVAGRPWDLLFRPAPEWLRAESTIQPLVTLVTGLVVTLLIAASLQASSLQAETVRRLVFERTAQLRESEARFQAVMDQSPTLIFMKDLEGRYQLFNQRLEEFWGLKAVDIKNRTDFELFPPAKAEAFRTDDQRVLSTGQSIRFEDTIESHGRKTTWIIQKFPLLNADGQPYAVCGICTDITDRKLAELELQEGRRQLSNLISQLPGVAFRCRFDENLSMLLASEGMLALTGYSAEEFTSGRIHLAALTVDADRRLVRGVVGAALAERRSFETEYRVRHRDGLEKWVLVRGQPFYEETGALRFIEGLAIDVTALKQAETERIAFERNLQETQKLESLGVLAGGIAHDFNNLLTAILGNASLMRYAQRLEPTGIGLVEQIETAARRAADLCSQMLAYAGKGKLSSGSIDLSHVVRDTTSLLRVSVGKNCRLDLQLAESLPAVLGDVTQLRQIVMNLVINGADAIGERAAGQITVTTFARELDAAFLRTALLKPKLPPGLYVGLEVRDNGCGMAPETIARIFEPFFTTKFAGRGLGLSAVLGIVQSHHGALFVESAPNQGAAFRLFLPAMKGMTDGPALRPPAPAAPTLRGTILVADDEASVRTMLGHMIQHHGATALLAGSGEQALEIYDRDCDRIDLILLDLTMPGLSGEQILARLRQLGARQKIILMSGHSEEEIMKRCAELGAVDFIHKPFEMPAVVAKLQSLLPS